MSALIIFTLLIALMLTGMPISIALGMTVLTFIFTMTNVPTESVALKLFTGIDNFEIMAIPFFILAGNFLTHGGVARRMINFATSMVGHWHGGLGLAGVMACALFAAVSGSSPAARVAGGAPLLVRRGFRLVAGNRDRDRLDHDAGDGQAGFPKTLRRRRHHHLGRARHPDPALDRDGDLLRGNRRQHRARSSRPWRLVGIRRPDVHGGRHPGRDAGDAAGSHDLLSRIQV